MGTPGASLGLLRHSSVWILRLRVVRGTRARMHTASMSSHCRVTGIPRALMRLRFYIRMVGYV